MWTSINNLMVIKKFNTIKTIIHNGQRLHNPKKIENALNEHYNKSVKAIRIKLDPMEILTKEMSKPTTKFTLEETTVEKTAKYTDSLNLQKPQASMK